MVWMPAPSKSYNAIKSQDNVFFLFWFFGLFFFKFLRGTRQWEQSSLMNWCSCYKLIGHLPPSPVSFIFCNMMISTLLWQQESPFQNIASALNTDFPASRAMSHDKFTTLLPCNGIPIQWKTYSLFFGQCVLLFCTKFLLHRKFIVLFHVYKNISFCLLCYVMFVREIFRSYIEEFLWTCCSLVAWN